MAGALLRGRFRRGRGGSRIGRSRSGGSRIAFRRSAFIQAIRLARSSGLDSPAKVILVPLANFLGLVSQAFIVAQSQLPPWPARSDE